MGAYCVAIPLDRAVRLPVKAAWSVCYTPYPEVLRGFLRLLLRAGVVVLLGLAGACVCECVCVCVCARACVCARLCVLTLPHNINIVNTHTRARTHTQTRTRTHTPTLSVLVRGSAP